MSSLLEAIGTEIDGYSLSGEDHEPLVKQCLIDTHEFKTQLKKFKAHLNKDLKELESHEGKELSKEQLKKIEKKRILISEKLLKSHKQWEHSIKKQAKQIHQQNIKFNKNVITKLYSEFKLDDINLSSLYNSNSERNPKNNNDIESIKTIADEALEHFIKSDSQAEDETESDFGEENDQVKDLNDVKKHVDKAVDYHISRFVTENLPANTIFTGDDSSSLTDYLKNVYNIDDTISSKFFNMGKLVNDLKIANYDSVINWSTPNSLLHFEVYLLKLMTLTKNTKFKSVIEILELLHSGFTDELLNLRLKQVLSKISPILTKLFLSAKSDTDNDNSDDQNQVPLISDETINIQLKKCITLFTKEYCHRNKYSFESPLFLVTLSGIISFKFFIKYRTIKASANVDWSTADELPFSVDLPEMISHFHPIFICPVLKEETTKENPPYSLPCHHVISRKALDRLSKNGSTTFKCPYCPVNASFSRTQKVNFVML